MSVTNRKLFRPRNARNKLNQMGGIMASSPELASTVAKFNLGGIVPTVGTGSITRAGITRDQFRDMSPTQQQQYLQVENDRRAAQRGMANLSTIPATVYDMFVGTPAKLLSGTVEGIANTEPARRAMKTLGILDPTNEEYIDLGYSQESFDPAYTYLVEDAIRANQPLTPSQFAIGLPSEPSEFVSTEEQYMQGPGATMPRPTVATEAPETTTAPAPITEDTTADVSITPKDVNAGGQTVPVPPGEADKQVTEAADLGAIFDQSNTQTESDPLGSSTGTDMEELKKKVMALMPQYDEESSTKRQGLLLAQMGAAIAAGKSGDAIQNIAEGMQKTLPAFIREGEKRDKFKAELEAGAAKIAATEGLSRDREARAEARAIAKEGRKKQNYFLESNVDMNIGGRQVTGKAGQLVRLNENEVNRAIENGIPLTTETALVNQLKLRAKAIENSTSAAAKFYNEKATTYSPEDSYFKGVRYYEPNPDGNVAGLSNMFTSSSINQIQSAYTNQKNELTSSLYLVDAASQLAPSATGLGGTFGRMRDSFIGVIGEERAKQFGLDPDSLSGASEFDVLQRIMAAKFAPILLGESGKTISDNDRIRVAALLGINLDTGELLPGVFKNPRQVQRALGQIKEDLIKNSNELDNEYTALLQGSYGPGMQPISVQPVALKTPEKMTMSEKQMEQYLSAFFNR
jgi:hypothetical protein